MLVNNLQAILVVNLQDERSRKFYDTLTAHQIASFQCVIDWHNPTHLPLVMEYQEDRHYKTHHDFPWVLVHLPWTHFNYTKKFMPDWVDKNRVGWKLDDNYVLLYPKEDDLESFNYTNINAAATDAEKLVAQKYDSDQGRFTFDNLCNQALDGMVEGIIENVQMAESYRVSYIKQELMLCSEISDQALLYFQGCQTVAELMIMYRRLDLSGILLKNKMLEEQIKSHCNVDLGVTIDFSTKPEPVPLPAGARKEALRLIETGS